MAVEAGTLVDTFLVSEYIGHGRLGAVYRACDSSTGWVAVKVLHRLSDPASRQSFAELAPELIKVTHTNLVRLHGHGERDGVPYLIEEYVQGETLADRFHRATVRRQAIVQILRGVAAGLDHAHGHGLLHGNLRPAQILLRAYDQQPVITDVGLAAMRRAQGMVIGAADGIAEYLAPEQVRGGRVTDASDRYALAAIAYQLLVDRPPFEGELEAVLAAHVSATPKPPSQRNRTLPAALDEVLIRGLARDPAARWPSCTDMVTATALALGEG